MTAGAVASTAGSNAAGDTASTSNVSAGAGGSTGPATACDPKDKSADAKPASFK
jgi:hypothetical protein